MRATILSLNPRGFGRLLTDNGEQLFFSSHAVARVSARRFDDLRLGDRVVVGCIVPGSSGRDREARDVRFLEPAEVQRSDVHAADTNDPLLSAFLCEAKACALRVDRPHGACAWFCVDHSGARQLTLEEAWGIVRRAGLRIGTTKITGADAARVLTKAQSLVKILTFDEWRGRDAA